jgi:hypothetical protein
VIASVAWQSRTAFIGYVWLLIFFDRCAVLCFSRLFVVVYLSILYLFLQSLRCAFFCLDTKEAKTERSDLMNTIKKQLTVNKSRQRQRFPAQGHTPRPAALCRGRRFFIFCFIFLSSWSDSEGSIMQATNCHTVRKTRIGPSLSLRMTRVYD